MSIKSAPYFWAQCDRCKTDAEYGDWSAMKDADQAVEFLGEDWLTINGRDGEKHYCPNCTVWSDDEDCFVPNFEPYPASTTGREQP